MSSTPKQKWNKKVPPEVDRKCTHVTALQKSRPISSPSSCTTTRGMYATLRTTGRDAVAPTSLSTGSRCQSILRPRKLGEESERLIAVKEKTDSLRVSPERLLLISPKTANGKSVTSPLRLQAIHESELSMLRSINRSDYSTRSTCARVLSPSKLRRHEYEDESDDDTASAAHPTSSSHNNQRIRMTEADEVLKKSRTKKERSKSAQTVRVISDNIFSEQGSSKQSTQGFLPNGHTNEEAIVDLQYDADFDCYYDPNNEKYYRIIPS